MVNLKPIVKQGQIHVNSITMNHRSDSVIILDIDCSAKYYEACCGGTEISLCKNDRTIGAVDDTDEMTIISISPEGNVEDEEWTSICETGRYNTRWILLAAVPVGEMIWTDADE